MKYLTNYIEDAQTEAFRKAGAFFAFSNDQFDEAKVEGVKYVSVGAGLICPKPNVESLMKSLDETHKAGIAQDIAENGKKAIIHRELGNHEYSITWSIQDTSYALEGYDITDEEIRAETKEYMRLFEEWEESQRKLHHYNMTFKAREVGAIGVVSNQFEYVEAEDEHEARMKLYEKYEHIEKLTIEELT